MPDGLWTKMQRHKMLLRRNRAMSENMPEELQGRQKHEVPQCRKDKDQQEKLKQNDTEYHTHH